MSLFPTIVKQNNTIATLLKLFLLNYSDIQTMVFCGVKRETLIVMDWKKKCKREKEGNQNQNFGTADTHIFLPCIATE